MTYYAASAAELSRQADRRVRRWLIWLLCIDLGALAGLLVSR